MSVFANRAKAKILNQNKKIKILFTEGWNKEIQIAAKFLKAEGIIEPIVLLRDENDDSLELDGIKKIIISKIDTKPYIDYFYELRKHKSVDLSTAKKLAIQPHYFSTLLLKRDEVDGVVCGIEYTTKDTLRAALQIIKQSKTSKIVTSAMMMEKDEQIMVMGDCSLALNPNSEELAEITKELILFAKETLTCQNLNTAMLSYSTIGSGAGESVDKVRKAYEIVIQDEQIKALGAKIYGEIQFDAAFVDAVRQKKAPNHPWDKKPNIYVFPNLDAGNIGYKILERCANYLAIGPVILGLDKPMNDLSRGASAQSVIQIAYITASQVK